MKAIKTLLCRDTVPAATSRNYDYTFSSDGRFKRILFWFPKNTQATTTYQFLLDGINIFQQIGNTGTFVGDDCWIDINVETPYQQNQTLRIAYVNNDTFSHTVYVVAEILVNETPLDYYRDVIG